ncbi:alpha/beta fold hydrolase [Aureitalea marina]|uniref:Alpha/beta hydrolase n=1 Tax=Aureitalea marina TaxID=930804 RepID=A0A2S7KPP9_9FLAO|nr:alpha/beta hydrolase [Aureitalea marina]PQB04591.1 alpha/beta hydrolase [Aureitalea marina]
MLKAYDQPDKIPVYFVPGLAAGEEIFRNIRLPEDTYQWFVLDWLIPGKREKLSEYAERMANRVQHENAVLVGVSFGGVVAQEMSRYLQLRKLIIISSVKTRQEMPRRLHYARMTRAYYLIPTRAVLSAKDLKKFAIGPRTKKRLAIYQEYLSVRNRYYLDWAIRNMVCWKRTVADPSVVHIHGDHDLIFPIENIDGVRTVENGTHVMIINKGRVVSNMIRDIVEN